MEYIKCIDDAFCKRVMRILYSRGFSEIEYSIHSNGMAVDFTITLGDGRKFKKIFDLDSINNSGHTYPESFIVQNLCRRAAVGYIDTDSVADIRISSLQSNYTLFKISGINYSHEIDKVIFNDPATIVFWKDGSKTIAKCGEIDIYDPEKGLAMCFAKKLLGNEGNYYNVFKKYLPKEDDIEQGCPFDEPPIYRQLKEASDKIYNKITNGGY